MNQVRQQLVIYGSLIGASAIGALHAVMVGADMSDGALYGQVAWCFVAVLYNVGQHIG